MEYNGKKKNNEKEITLELIKAANDAGKRVRFILLIIVTASILAFAGFWNALFFSWKTSRITSLETLNSYLQNNDEVLEKFLAALRNAKSDEKKKRLAKAMIISQDESIKTRLEKAIKSLVLNIFGQDIGSVINKVLLNKIDNFKTEGMKYWRGYLVFPENLLNDEEKNRIEELANAIKYFMPEKLGRDGIRELLVEYKKLDIETIKTIKIPFFGISFDINDLGIIGGGAFCIILFIFSYSLDRELTNLKIVHGYISYTFEKTKDRVIFYYLLSMHQLLSFTDLPNLYLEGKNMEQLPPLKKNFPKFLYFLPFMLFSFILLYDVCTMPTGLKISELNTITGISASFIVAIIIFRFSRKCERLSYDIDDLWVEIKKELDKAKSEIKKEKKVESEEDQNDQTRPKRDNFFKRLIRCIKG